MKTEIRIMELRPVETKPRLMKANVDEATLDQLMHSDEFYEVGYRTAGGQYRFFTERLFDYLRRKTRCQY